MANTKVTGDLIADGTITAANLVSGTLDALLNSYLTTNTYATQGYVTTAVNNLIDAAPASLDTLNELAAALNDDANFATTVTNSLATKLNLSGGTLTGALSFQDTSIPSAGTASVFSRDTNSYLYLQTGSGNQIQLLDGSQNTMAIFNPSSVSFSISNSPALTIDSNSNVGINTTTPSATLDVHAPSTTAPSLTMGAAAGQIFKNEDLEFAFGLNNVSPYNGWIQTRFAGNNSRSLAINPLGGSVGIGTNSPGAKLDVIGIVRSYAASNNYAQLNNGSFQAVGDHGGTFMIDVDNNGTADLVNVKKSGSSKFYIQNGGNVGIGTTTPATLLTTVGSAYSVSNSGRSVGGILVYADSGGVGGYGGAISFGTGGLGSSAIAAVSGPGSDRDVNGLAFFTHGSSSGLADSSEAMRIQYDGNVGIGTNTPSGNLHIADSQDAVLKIEGDTGNNDETKGPKILLLTDGGFKTAAITAGNATYETSGGNYNALNLQGFNIRFHTATVQDYDATTEIARFTADGLTFNGDTAAANALDDYEEGTFTPTLNNAGSPTYSRQFGQYTKIGNLVFVTIKIEASNITSSGNVMSFTLPFTASPSSDTSQRSSGLVEGDWVNMGLYVDTLRFRVSGANTQAVRDNNGSSVYFAYNNLGSTTIEFNTSLTYLT